MVSNATVAVNNEDQLYGVLQVIARKHETESNGCGKGMD